MKQIQVTEETLLHNKETRDYVIEYLGLVNILIATKDRTIATKDRTIAVMDKHIASLKSELSENDNIIKLLRQRISDLEWQRDNAHLVSNSGLAS